MAELPPAAAKRPSDLTISVAGGAGVPKPSRLAAAVAQTHVKLKAVAATVKELQHVIITSKRRRRDIATLAPFVPDCILQKCLTDSKKAR